MGHDLGARHLFAAGGSKLGPPLLEQYGNAGTHSTVFYWSVLATFTVVLLGSARLALAHRSRTAAR
jgi:hypothetical protein